MMMKLNKKTKRKLQNEYDDLRANGGNMLEWCTQKAREAGLSYGYFVKWLGR